MTDAAGNGLLRKSIARAGTALVVLCFCAPLFLGLDSRDLGNDEAIYSYAVARILETGDWLTPRSIPFDGPFLEKPPLSFWMVAAPIAIGVLPFDEVGFRAVPALLGAVSLLYVFALGRWWSGMVGGIAAVAALYSLDGVVHALRTNTMEAPLMLAYTGGLYHFARWADPERSDSAAWHRWPVALYFVLGFLTKFVAVLFLPLICLAAVVMRPASSGLLRSLWRAWLGPAGLALALIAPWFVYQTATTGSFVWLVMFGQHIYARFTTGLDASHLQPWQYYFSGLWQMLEAAGWQWLAVGGAGAAIVAATRRDGWLPRVLLFWGVVPIALLSFGSSKLPHYIYPFVPPVALAAGYASALVFDAVAAAVMTHLFPRVLRALPARSVPVKGIARRGLIGVAVLAAAVAVVTALRGGIRMEAGDVELFRNTSLARPVLVASLALLAAGELRSSARALALVPLLVLLPIDRYPDTWTRAFAVDRPLRAARDCVLEVRRSGAAGQTVYNAAPALTYHTYNYYLRGFEPWERVERPDRDHLRRRLLEPGQQSPVLISESDYLDVGLPVVEHADRALMLSAFRADPGLMVLLPGPYARCGAPAVQAGARPATWVAPAAGMP